MKLFELAGTPFAIPTPHFYALLVAAVEMRGFSLRSETKVTMSLES
jgi:hypothetical protein